MVIEVKMANFLFGQEEATDEELEEEGEATQEEDQEVSQK